MQEDKTKIKTAAELQALAEKAVRDAEAAPPSKNPFRDKLAAQEPISRL